MSEQTLATRRHFVKIVGAAGATAAVGPFFHARPAKADKGELVVVSWGGSWAKSLREVMFTPFEKETGYKVRDDGPPEAAKLKAMVQSGSVTWDVLDTDLPAIQTMVEGRAAGSDRLQRSSTRRSSTTFRRRSRAATPSGTRSTPSTSSTTRRRSRPASIRARGPRSGTARSSRAGGRSTSAAASRPSSRSPCSPTACRWTSSTRSTSSARGRASDRLRPLVTKWYQSHAEAIQLVTAGECRHRLHHRPARHHAKRSGAPVDVDYNQGKLGSDYWYRGQGVEEPGGRAPVHQLRPRRQAPGGHGEGESLRAEQLRPPSSS